MPEWSAETFMPEVERMLTGDPAALRRAFAVVDREVRAWDAAHGTTVCGDGMESWGDELSALSLGMSGRADRGMSGCPFGDDEDKFPSPRWQRSYSRRVPNKQQFRRLRRLRLIGTVGGLAVPIGILTLVSVAGDAAQNRAGGLTGIVVGLVLTAAGICAATWAIRAHHRVAVAELQDLRARGLDDGLPMGAFRRDQRVGLDASDTWLVLGALTAGVGVMFAMAGATDPQVGWRFGVAFSLVGFLPAALCFRLGTGTKYWLTPDGVAKRDGLEVAVRYADVERIVPLHNGDPVPTPI